MDLSQLGQHLLQQSLLPMLGYLSLGIPFMLLERRYPAVPVAVRHRVVRDLAACAMVFLNASAISVFVGSLELWRHLDFLPLVPWWVAVPASAVAIDFSLYWLHRALHTKWLWPIHRWHHAPTDIYWLSGIRASLPQNLLYVLVGIGWAIALRVPARLFVIGALGGALGNHFMHTNLGFALPWLERVVITPRAHRLHHRKTETGAENFGAFFALWDHLFGSWSDPDRAPPAQQVGISDRDHPLWWVAGL